MKKSVTRLYSLFQPEHYDLAIKLFPDKKTFEGNVVIAGKRLGRPSQRLTFHQKGLKIDDVSIRRVDKKGDQIYEVDRINSHRSFDEIRLHTKEKLFPGEYVVMMHFRGKITDPMNGVYPSYFKHDDQEKMLLATQFESHHAREVFPCIDEPEAKATFSLTLCTPDKGEVISNTPVTFTTTNDEGFRITDFEKTPVMSTYLLAFAYGDIGYLEAKTQRGTLVRTYATPDNVPFTEFALDTAVKVLEFYEDYFAIPYPLDKCDMLALPDFASGAMENWGLITYREQALLVDPKNTSLSTKQYVAMVVAHELAHQWFGNLVTMRWWTDLWLNEGFASWIEYLAVDHLFPDWGMWTQFIASEQQAAFKLDALDNTHPIEVPIKHPDEIRSIFDAISYSKGASVIHMLYGYLGADAFQKGLRHYLQIHEYGNADTKDLWTALEQTSGKPVKRFMHAWTSLPGHPLVTVSHNDHTVNLHQERFYFERPQKIQSMQWPVPILAGGDMPTSFDTESVDFTSDKPVKINRGQSGFYRTRYDDATVQSIAPQIAKSEPLDRLGLLADSFETAKAGYGSIVESMRLLDYYNEEDNAAVWDIIASNLAEIRRVMDDKEIRELLKPFIRKLTTKQIERLGWDEKPSDTHFDKLLRPTVLGLAASAENTSVVDECLKRFGAAKSPENIPADLRSVVFNTAARKGDETTFDKLLHFHNATDNSEERVTLAAALTSFEQPELNNKALELIPTKTVRRQDAMYWIAYSFMNRFSKHATWEWLKENWAWLDKEMGSDLSFYRTPIYAARSFSDLKFLKEYSSFFEHKQTPALERSIQQGREMLEWQIGWKQRDLPYLKKYLSEKAADKN